MITVYLVSKPIIMWFSFNIFEISTLRIKVSNITSIHSKTKTKTPPDRFTKMHQWEKKLLHECSSCDKIEETNRVITINYSGKTFGFACASFFTSAVTRLPSDTKDLHWMKLTPQHSQITSNELRFNAFFLLFIFKKKNEQFSFHLLWRDRVYWTTMPLCVLGEQI